MTMMLLVVCCVLFAVVGGVASNADEFPQETDGPEPQSFEAWVKKFGKEYPSDTERNARKKIWNDNDEFIKFHNNKIPTPTFTMGHNEFSDMTDDEFSQNFHLGNHSKMMDMHLEYDDPPVKMERLLRGEGRGGDGEAIDIPATVNWVTAGAVTPVQHQGRCGSCWTFAGAAALEGLYKIKTGTLVKMSEQNLLDCIDPAKRGCNGGFPQFVFDWVKKRGICTAASDPYTRNVTACSTCNLVPNLRIRRYVDVTQGNLMALKRAIRSQPVAVIVEAHPKIFKFYKSGVITDNACGASGFGNHAVAAVGYGTHGGIPSFMIKNSWGTRWGVGGYAYIGEHSTNINGVCAILSYSSFPVW